MLFIIHVYPIMCLCGLVDKLVATQLLKDDSLKLIAVKPVSAFWASWPPCYICWVRHVLTLALLFKSLEKSWMGTRLLELEELGLWSTSQLSLWKWSLHLKIGVVFPLSILWGCIIFTNTLCNKHCLMILPLFIAICEIWLSGLTYGAYLVLFLKPDATFIFQMIMYILSHLNI